MIPGAHSGSGGPAFVQEMTIYKRVSYPWGLIRLPSRPVANRLPAARRVRWRDSGKQGAGGLLWRRIQFYNPGLRTAPLLFLFPFHKRCLSFGIVCCSLVIILYERYFFIRQVVERIHYLIDLVVHSVNLALDGRSIMADRHRC